MDKETRRLIEGMADRARTRKGFIGHAIAQWEAQGRSAVQDLGLDAEGIARICVTPIPSGPNARQMTIALAAELGADADILIKILQGETHGTV